MIQLQTQKPVYVIGVKGEGLGVGKSITEVALALLACEAGYEIYTNMRSLKLPHHDFYEEILPYLDAILAGEWDAPEHAFYLLDDVNKFIESRRSGSDLVISVMDFIQDVRKAGESVCVFAIPHLMWTDPRLFDIGDLVISCSFDKPNSILYWTVIDYTTFPRSFSRLSLNAKPLFDLYDTNEKIRIPHLRRGGTEEAEEEPKLYACPRCKSTATRYVAKLAMNRCDRCGKRFKIEEEE